MVDRAFDLARLEQLLAGVGNDELSLIFGRRRFYALNRLVSGRQAGEFHDADIPRYSVALHGARLLDEPAVLSALLRQLPASHLQGLAKKYLDRPFRLPADNALALASKPLRNSSALARDILSSLGLSELFLEEVERKSAVEVIEPYDPLPALMDYQNEVRAKSLGLLTNNVRELLIQMPTGAGKTRTAMELVVDLIEANDLFAKGKSVIWLAHTEELCEQAIDSFSSVWATRGSKSAKVARLWGGYSPTQAQINSALVVAGTARMHALRSGNSKVFENLSSSAEVIVVDEAHRALAPTVFSQIAELRRSGNGLLIGLSATPARSSDWSEENSALVALFGGNLVTPALGDDPINELRRRGVLSLIERVELNYSSSENETTVSTAESKDDDSDLPESLLTELAENGARNVAIINELEKRASRQEPAIVFCCSVEHADLLAAALRLRGIRAAAIDCRMRRGARRLVIKQFSEGEVDVLLNFGVLSTGFDAPNVRTVVIARPTKSMILYSQMLGRGLRGPKMGGTASCVLIDVRDHLGRFGDLSDLYLRFKPYWSRSGGAA